MLNLPLISFVVTSYNYERFLCKTLDSIKAQTYKNFEVIIVDDASSDNSVCVAEKFIAENQDLRVTLLVNETNQGQLASMLRGVRSAVGTFVSFVDSDDMLLPDYAKLHIQTHMATSVAFTSCKIIEIGEDDEVHTMNSISSPACGTLEDLFEYEKANFEILKKKKFGGWYWSPNSSAVYRKSSIELLLDYKNPEKWKICPDKFIMNYSHLIGGSAIICTPLLAYRRHSDNAGNCNLVTGNKKLHTDKTTMVNFLNNVKIRPEMLKFLWSTRKKRGLRSTLCLLCSMI